MRYRQAVDWRHRQLCDAVHARRGDRGRGRGGGHPVAAVPAPGPAV